MTTVPSSREESLRIVYIAAGAGPMYCGACARDAGLIRELTRRGHDVQTVPLYTPLRMDGTDPLPTSPIFFGGISVFLQQASALFRHAPAVVHGLLDHPSLLNLVSRFAIETDARQLGPMTVSMLQGTQGFQQRSLNELLDYLTQQAHPDIINVTNTLLSGLAPELKARLGVPLVYTLQGEDLFVESMPDFYRVRARDLMRENARSIDLFIAPSESYAARMAGYLQVPPEKIRVIRAGIEAERYQRSEQRQRDPFTIGYLSSILPTKGLDALVDAVALLVKRKRDVMLRIAGRIMNARYWKDVQRKIAAERLTARVEYCGEVDFAGKLDFLRHCSVFAVPSRMAESRGMVALEAMAAGVPVVAPKSGVFPEMMALTGGGVLTPSGNIVALADALARLQDDPDAADHLASAGALGVPRFFAASRMAEQVETEYRQLLAGKTAVDALPGNA